MVRTLDEDALVAMYIAVALMMGVGRALGEFSRKLKQPMVMGELLTGIFLGKTLLGNVWPDAWDYMFKRGEPQSVGVAAISSLSASFFMLIAGMEVRLVQVMRRKYQTSLISLFTLVLPFFLGFGPAMIWPGALGRPGTVSESSYAVFLGGQLCVTALPVVAKTLRDMGLIRTNMGVLVMAASTVCGIVSIIVALAPSNTGDELARNVSLSLVFLVGMLGLMRYVFDRILPWVQSKLSWPGGVIGMIGVVTVVCAAFSTWLGLHATLGAFIAGATFGDTPHLREATRRVLDQFVSFIFVPIFFASTGIYVDFVGDFDVGLVFLLMFLSFAGKLVGGYAGARLSGSDHRESLAVALCMNSRGGIAIIVANAALNVGLIDNKVFVALTITAIVSSVITGPLLNMVVVRAASPPFTDFVKARRFFPSMARESKEAALRQLAAGLADTVPTAYDLVVEEERRLVSGGGFVCVDDRVAVPVVRVLGLSKPAVALGLSREGVSYVSESEGESVQVVVMAFLPDRVGEEGVRAFTNDVRAVLSSPELRETFLNCGTLHELRTNMQVARAYVSVLPKLLQQQQPPRPSEAASLRDSSGSLEMSNSNDVNISVSNVEAGLLMSPDSQDAFPSPMGGSGSTSEVRGDEAPASPKERSS